MKKNIKIIILIVSMFLVVPVKAMKMVDCGGLGDVPYRPLQVVGKIITIMQIAVPILLVIMGMLDFSKAVVATEEKKMDEAGKLFVKRIIYGVLVFFVVAIVKFVFGLLGTSNDVFSCASCVLGNTCKTTDITVGDDNIRTENEQKADNEQQKRDDNMNEGASDTKDYSSLKVTIKNKTSSLGDGQELKLDVSVEPSNVKNKEVTYSSGDTSVATISKKGKITAKKEGKTKITVTLKSNPTKKDSFQLTVTDSKIFKRTEVVTYAKRFVGRGYVYGGNWNGELPYTSTDCSGFVKGVYAHYKYTLQRTSSAQSQDSKYKKIDPTVANLKPGDLIFYGNGSSVSHVAMYIGDSQIVHASSPQSGIKISPFNYKTPITARRIIK